MLAVNEIEIESERKKRMKNLLRKILNLSAPLVDVVILLPTLVSCCWLKIVRQLGVSRLPLARGIFKAVGIYPLRDHYYEPMFNPDRLRKSLREDRLLPGINWNLDGQKQLISKFTFAEEIKDLARRPHKELQYSFQNDTYCAGDSEYLYSIIRLYKPKRIIEIGSGNSTLMAIEAIKKNRQEDPNYVCEHICIEPFERPWLERLNIKLVRQLVENVDRDIFKSLGENDILFIDSSHVIRPQGDVLCEYLEILPGLKPGVLVHVHDIFSPKDYLDQWVHQDMKLWNEQYLLEAFLSHNKSFEIIGALNFLKYHGADSLAKACPVFGASPNDYEPGSFWMRRI